jgi:inosine-uridine nucleoside N-ribohydrolase
VYAENGLDGPDLSPPPQPEPEHAIDRVAKTVAESPTPVTLVATGPLTTSRCFSRAIPSSSRSSSGSF